MTGEEKRKKLKEQYKRDLKLRKEFLDKAKTLRHTKKINDAVSDMIDGLTGDDSDDWINKLNEESALSEARMEIAFDDENSTEQELKRLAREEENKKFEAADLVTQMKREMGLLPEEEEVVEEEAPAEEEAQEEPVAESEESTPDNEDDKEPPKKRLGDF